MKNYFQEPCRSVYELQELKAARKTVQGKGKPKVGP